jgi:hypothetical protein
MLKFFTFALAWALTISAQASEWKQFTPTAYLLAPSEDQEIFAMASLNGDTIVVNLVDYSGSLCGESTSSKLSPTGPYKVNGTNIKFIQACINGNRIISPETQKGKAFFANAITGGPASVEFDRGVVLHFTSENFESAKKSMLDTRSAL